MKICLVFFLKFSHISRPLIIKKTFNFTKSYNINEILLKKINIKWLHFSSQCHINEAFIKILLRKSNFLDKFIFKSMLK